jgi:hypothetical protein
VAAGVGVGEGVGGSGVAVGGAGVSLGTNSGVAVGRGGVVGVGVDVSVGAGSGVAVGVSVSVGAGGAVTVGVSVSVATLTIEGGAKTVFGVVENWQAARKAIPITALVKIRNFPVFKCILYSLWLLTRRPEHSQ